MVWEQNSYVVVMLTKEQEKGYIKCTKYWPEEVKDSVLFENICLRIELESEELVPNATCVVRTIRMEKLEDSRVIKTRRITQLHFVGWPDHGVPDSPDTILNLVNKANEVQQQYIANVANSQVPHGKVGPIIVHCSAGCGRTGTFCTVDTALAMLPNFKDDKTDLINFLVGYFRTQRRTMVQTLTQFQYCYLAVLSKLVTNR
ncbi:15458_t:CDS:1, partial [Acaulospora morrowiae]